MKKIISLFLTLTMVLSMCSFAGADSLAGTYDIKVWVANEIKELTEQQIKEFNDTNDLGIVFNATVEAQGEGDAATAMVQDVEAGGDIFCFAQDQFSRLIQAGALSKLGQGAAKTVKEGTDANAVAAVTTGDDTLWAYPVTADNTYFMYYDKSVIPEEDIDSLEKIIADCEAAGKNFNFELQTSAWYLASFFFGTGCVSVWKTDDAGQFVDVTDTFNSDKGLIAAKGMKKLLDSPIHVSSSEASGFANNAAVVITGTWASADIKAMLGDNMGVADLPSFEVDGTEYHLGSFFGYKLMGVKPQTDAVKGAALHRLAQYLTGAKCSLERFALRGWGPANLEAQADEAVANDPILAAVIDQAQYGVVQGAIHGSWWDVAKVIGDEVKAATDEAGLKQALQNYEDKMASLFTLDTSALLFVGAWNGWNNADTADTYYLKDGSLTLDVPESDYMGGRIVAPGDWSTDKGFAQVTTGAELIKDLGADNPDNNIVFAEAGNYTLTWDGEAITIVKN
ncbi:MAG: extracellular solute-binding protein [Clostridia bacterium]|nr:extracellular solute-binding protein [Clostridia bacterium]